MGMSAFGLMILLCLLSVCVFVKSASILENSNDLWQNWLLNENEEVPSQQSSPLSRRITPKSVFIAPTFSECSDGLRMDEMGKCVRVIKVNGKTQWELVLERLKLISAQLGLDKRQSESDNNSDSAEKNNPKKPDSYAAEDNTGPFHFDIPISSKNSSETFNSNGTTTTEKPKEISTTERTITSQTNVKVTETSDIADSTTEDLTTTSDTTFMPPSGTTEYTENTDGTPYDTEVSNTEPTTVLTTTEESVTTFNTASHSCPGCTEDTTEIATTPVVRKLPNYSSVVPLKIATNNKNVQIITNEGRITNSKPLASYSDSRYDNIKSSSSVVTTIRSPPIYNINRYNDQDVSDDSKEVIQKLPSKSNERVIPKCDPSNPNCVQVNVLKQESSPLFTLNQKPATFVRFPSETSNSYVRFPVHKVTGYDDTSTYSDYAETGWDLRYPYASSWYSMWKSPKPTYIRIRPGNGEFPSVGFRSQPQLQTQAAWVNG